MHQPPAYTTWKVTCQSSADAHALREWLASGIDLDRVMTDTVRVAPNGVEQVQAVEHRLGDYFSEIRILPDTEENPASFRLVFRKRPQAKKFWKDLMVSVLQGIEATPQKASIELDSKGETQPVTRARVKMEREKKPLPAKSRPPVWLMIVLAVLCVGTTAFAFIKGGSLSTFEQQLTMLFACVLCTVVLFFGTSYAAIEGAMWGTKYHFGGAAALAIALYIMLYQFVPSEMNRHVNVYLEYQRQPLLKEFRVTVRIPGNEDNMKHGERGSCILLIPSQIKSIDLAVTCTGYRVKQHGPYAIDAGVIRVAMVRTGNMPPRDPSGFPTIEGIRNPATEEMAMAEPRVKPTDVTFRYKNATDVDLRLLILNWSQYYDKKEKGVFKRKIWDDWDFPANDEYQSYDKFQRGSGWVSFFVVSDENSRPVSLGLYNIFTSK
jgi:hypothetical protein